MTKLEPASVSSQFPLTSLHKLQDQPALLNWHFFCFVPALQTHAPSQSYCSNWKWLVGYSRAARCTVCCIPFLPWFSIENCVWSNRDHVHRLLGNVLFGYDTYVPTVPLYWHLGLTYLASPPSSGIRCIYALKIRSTHVAHGGFATVAVYPLNIFPAILRVVELRWDEEHNDVSSNDPSVLVSFSIPEVHAQI